MPICTSRWKKIRGSESLIKSGLLAFLLIATLTIFSFIPGNPVSAQSTGISVQSVDVRHEFPNSVTYSATASAAADIVVAELYWHATDDPALNLEEPAFETSTTISIEHTVDMRVNYLPPGTEIAFQWRFEDLDGNVISSPDRTLKYTDLRFDWKQESSGPITVWWYRGYEDFGNEILDRAGLSLSNLSRRFEISLTSPVEIVVYGSDRDFSSAMPPNSADWIGGVAYASLDLIVAQIAPGSGSSSEIDRLISHEISHLAVHQTTENSYNSPPNWLDEGLATYNQATDDNRLSSALDDAIRNGRLIPVRALNSSFPLDDSQALLSYAESWSLVEYIIEVYGDHAVADLLAVFKQEVSYDEAVETVLNLTYEELDAGWKAWLGYPGDDPAVIAKAASTGNDSGSSSGIWIAAGTAGVLFCIFTITIAFASVVLLSRRRTNIAS